MSKTYIALFSLMALGIFAPCAHAQDYMIGGIGQSSTGAQPNIQRGSVAFDIGYGVRKHLNYALEAGIASFNTQSVTPKTIPAQTGAAMAIYWDFVGILPVEYYLDADFPLELTARAGAAYTRSSGNLAGGVSVTSAKVGLTYGAGAQYAISDKTAIRLQWDRYALAKNTGYSYSSESLITVGLNRYF